MFIIKLSMALILPPAQLANAQNTHFTNSYGIRQKGGNKRSNKKRSNKKRSNKKRSKRSKSGGQPISLNFGLGSRTPLPLNQIGAANPPPIMYVKNTCAK
jgi:hypothetical protein